MTVTPGGATFTPTSTAIPPSSCDKAQFIADVTVPDGTVMNPGQLFTKTGARVLLADSAPGGSEKGSIGMRW